MQPASNQINVDRAGYDRLVRRRLSLWDRDATHHPALLNAYQQWEKLRPDGLIPSRSEFDLTHIRSIMATVSLVDTTAEDPADYTFRLLGREVHPVMMLPKRRIRDIPSSVLREAVMQDYYACVSSGVPIYHEIVARIDYLTWPYARLILPFARDRRRIDELMVCSVAIELPELTQRLQ